MFSGSTNTPYQHQFQHSTPPCLHWHRSCANFKVSYPSIDTQLFSTSFSPIYQYPGLSAYDFPGSPSISTISFVRSLIRWKSDNFRSETSPSMFIMIQDHSTTSIRFYPFTFSNIMHSTYISASPSRINVLNLLNICATCWIIWLDCIAWYKWRMET